MDEQRACDTCKKALKPGDCIVFTPDGSSTEKHLCMSCFEGMSAPGATH
jgi:hypothetical protein